MQFLAQDIQIPEHNNCSNEAGENRCNEECRNPLMSLIDQRQ